MHRAYPRTGVEGTTAEPVLDVVHRVLLEFPTRIAKWRVILPISKPHCPFPNLTMSTAGFSTSCGILRKRELSLLRTAYSFLLRANGQRCKGRALVHAACQLTATTHVQAHELELERENSRELGSPPQGQTWFTTVPVADR